MTSLAEFKCVESKKTGRFSVKRPWIVQKIYYRIVTFLTQAAGGLPWDAAGVACPFPAASPATRQLPHFVKEPSKVAAAQQAKTSQLG